jgi:hypothetical protein
LGAASGLAPLAVGAIGAAVGAVGAVAANAVIQGVNIALGMQKSFDWKSLVIDGLVGLVTGGLAGLGTIVSAAKNISTTVRVLREVGMGVATGFVESTLRQGLGIALQTQKEFSWVQVGIGVGTGAASGLVSGGIGAKLAQQETKALEKKAASEIKAVREMGDAPANALPAAPRSRGGEVRETPVDIGKANSGAAVRGGIFNIEPSVARRAMASMASYQTLGIASDIGVAAGATAVMSAASGEPFDFSYFTQMAISNAAGRGAGSAPGAQKAIAKIRSIMPKSFSAPPPAAGKTAVLNLSEDKAVQKTAHALASKSGRKEMTAGDVLNGGLSRLDGDSKLMIPGHGDPNSLDGMTPKQLARVLKNNGLTEIGDVSLVACNSGTAVGGKKSYAEQLAVELSAQGIKFKSISGRDGQVAALADGRKVTVNKNQEIFSKGKDSKIVVRNQLDEDGNFIVDRNPYKIAGTLRDDLDAQKLLWLGKPVKPLEVWAGERKKAVANLTADELLLYYTNDKSVVDGDNLSAEFLQAQEAWNQSGPVPERVKKIFEKAEENFYHEYARAGSADPGDALVQMTRILGNIRGVIETAPVPRPAHAIRVGDRPAAAVEQLPVRFDNETDVLSDILNHPDQGWTRFSVKYGKSELPVHHSSAGSKKAGDPGTVFWVNVGDDRVIVASGRHATSEEYIINWLRPGIVVASDPKLPRTNKVGLNGGPILVGEIPYYG